eukprot:Skav202580  [mRNA]  locus=scaffold1305:1875:12033:- [translate_table: standard]
MRSESCAEDCAAIETASGPLVAPAALEGAGPQDESKKSKLLQLCCTVCQAKAFRAILEAVCSTSSECQRVLSLTGRRGRGKSTMAALGMVAALQQGRSVVVLIVDEMASLAIPTLHKLLSAKAPLVLLLGTLSGAEGAAIQEKVFKELGADSAEACHHAILPVGMSQRLFVKLSLHEAVRYKPQDPVENWLDSLLFLDVPPPLTDPKAYGTLKMARFLEIDTRDTRSSSPLLFAVMGLLRGHYRTSPNDLARLVSDPHIRTFALVANEGAGPPAVAVVAIEETPERLGKSGAKVHQTHLLANGFLFATGVEKEYPHLALARLWGLRPWRVVAAPALRGRGFGQKALELLELHVRLGEPIPGEPQENPSQGKQAAEGTRGVSFDWLGVSFGLTANLFRFWSRAGYHEAVGAQMLSLEEAAQRLGRGDKAGDRQNDVASKLRTVAKERRPMLEVLLERSHSHSVAQMWLPPLLELREQALRVQKSGIGQLCHSRPARVPWLLFMVVPHQFQHRRSVASTWNQSTCTSHAFHRNVDLLSRQEPHFGMLVSGDARRQSGVDAQGMRFGGFAHQAGCHLATEAKRIELRLAKKRFACIEAQSYFRIQKASPPQTAMLLGKTLEVWREVH